MMENEVASSWLPHIRKAAARLHLAIGDALDHAPLQAGLREIADLACQSPRFASLIV